MLTVEEEEEEEEVEAEEDRREAGSAGNAARNGGRMFSFRVSAMGPRASARAASEASALMALSLWCQRFFTRSLTGPGTSISANTAKNARDPSDG
jgi:hypothetical protein